MLIEKKTLAATAAKLRRVRFSNASKMLQIREIESDPDKRLWYTVDDYDAFRNLAQSSGSDSWIDDNVTRALDIVSSKHCSQTAMDYWSYHGQSSRGLENFVHPMLGMTRQKQKTRCIKSVLIAQSVILQNEEAGIPMDAELFIASVSSKESIVSKKFATMMGRADENAVHNPASIERGFSKVVAPSA